MQDTGDKVDALADALAEELNAAIRKGRIFTFVLVVALVLFAAVVLGINAAHGPMVGPLPPVPEILGGMAAVTLVAGVFIGPVMERRLAAKARRGEEVPIQRGLSMIIFSAVMIEYPAVLGAVVGLMWGLPYLLITLVSCALLIVQCVRVSDRIRSMVGLGADYVGH